MRKPIEVTVNPLPDWGAWSPGSLVFIAGNHYRIVGISDDRTKISLEPFHGYRLSLYKIRSWLRWQLLGRVR